MMIRYSIPLALAGFLSLTGCMTSEKWVDDDVYVMKSSEIPTDTDITDETDYNAYVYNRRNNPAQTSYYSQFYFVPSFSLWMRPGYYSDFGWIGGRGGYYGMGFYDPNYYAMFGYGYVYDPFWGYYTPYYPGYFGYPYGYGGYYGYGYGYNPVYGYGGNGGTIAGQSHYTGPRGGISGYGGVRSNSPQAYKYTPGTLANGATPIRHTADPVKTNTKPVTPYDRAGRNSGVPSGRTVSGTSFPNDRPTATVASRNPGTAVQARVPRPESTTVRSAGRSSSGSAGASPARSGNSGRNYSGSGRNPGSYSNGNGSVPRQSSGSSGVSGSGSSRSGSSGGGTKTVGRR